MSDKFTKIADVSDFIKTFDCSGFTRMETRRAFQAWKDEQLDNGIAVELRGSKLREALLALGYELTMTQHLPNVSKNSSAYETILRGKRATVYIKK